jgi:gliding motility-associated-like protein
MHPTAEVLQRFLMKARIITFLLLLLTHFGFGQIMVNELMASNSSIIKDNSGAYSDWIELYNSGNSEVDLNNYFISDNPEKLDKSQFKSTNGSLKIASKGFLLIWCSGFPNRGDNHVSFSLSAASESIILSNSELKIVNQLDFSNQRKDISYGRTTNGGNEIRYFRSATPGKSNQGIETYLGVLSSPNFSNKGGFYDKAFNLTLTHQDPNVKIIYTTDGSIPDELNLNGKNYNYKNQYVEIPGQPTGQMLTSSYKSNPYNTPIDIKSKKTVANKISQISSTWHFAPFYFPNFLIPKATVVRAVATKSGYLTSEIATETYFLDDNKAKNPEFDIISLNVQEDHLFSYDKGVYNAGKLFDEYRIKNPTAVSEFCTPGNFTQEGDEFERPVNFELFRNNTQAVNQDISFKIHGACSRSIPYKSIRLYGKNDFGKFSFFPENPDLLQDNFILRNSGDDYWGTLIRDVFVHDLVGHFNFGSQKTQPAVVYLNGEYWGIQNIRERLDKYYLNRKYGVNLENIDLRKVIWNGPDETEYGDDVHFNEMMNFLNNNDLSNNEIYDKAITYLDPQSLIDYQIAEIFVGNIDWPQNNVRLWRNKTPNYAPFAPTGLDGRWRFLFYDADKSLGMIVNAQHDALQIALQKDENAIFKAFIKNEKFRNTFILRFLDHLNTSFDKANSLKVFGNLVKKYAPEVPNHLNRWKTISNFAAWENNTKIVEKYLTERPESTKRFLKDNFGQFQERILTVTTTDSTMGYIRVNSIDINSDQPGVMLKKDGSWQGTYFSEIPLTIVARPLPGHRFLYWEHENQKITDSLLVVFLNQNESYKAYFEQIALADESTIAPASLADCGYFLNEWSSFSAKGSTPPNAKFVFLNQRDPNNSSKIAGFTSGEFNHSNRSRIVGLEKEGLSFVNTGGPSENDGYPYGQLGGIVVAINTIGLDSAWVSWTAKTIIPGERKYGLKLLYRIGSTEEFKEIDVKTNYTGTKKANDSTTFSKIPIPKSALNQPYVQFFWKYFYTGEGKNGPRDELGLDDIFFETNLDTPLSQNGGRISVSESNTFPSSEVSQSFKVSEMAYKITSDNYSSVRPKTPSISSKKTEVCGTEKLILKATGCTNGTIFWSNGEVGTEISVAEGGYYAYCSASCGVSENSNTLNINRVQKSAAPIIEASQDKVCDGEAITLRANFCSGQVFWSNGIVAEKIIVKPTASSTYSASCYANQCLSDESPKKQIQIGIPNKPSIKINKKELCIGETTYLTGENCDGLVQWSSNIDGEIFKFVAEKPGAYQYKARCKSVGGDCISDWSEALTVTVNEVEKAPNTLAELVYDCSQPSLDLKTSILDSIKTGDSKYIFQKDKSPNTSILSNTKNVIPGEYYVFKKNENGCISSPSKISVKAPNCAKSFTENLTKNTTNLAVEISTASTQFVKNQEIEIFINLKNTGNLRATNGQVEVEWPQNIQYIAGSSTATFTNNKLIFNNIQLSSGNNTVLKFKVLSKTTAISTIWAKVSRLDQQDSDLENNTASLTLYPTEGIGLSIHEVETSLISTDIYEKTLEITLENALQEDISPIQLNLNLNKYFGNGAQFISQSLTIEGDEKFRLNPEYDGKAENDAIFMDSLSVLLAQKSQKVKLKFRVNLSQTDRTAYPISGKIHSRSNLVDFSTSGDNPDPDHDGNFGNNNEHTILKFEKSPSKSAISVSQVIVDSVKTNTYNHKYTFMVLIQNHGTIDLKNIGLSNNLDETFGKNVTVTKNGDASVSKYSQLKINAEFDGKENIAMLIPNENHFLKPSEIDTLFYSINVNHQDNFGPFFHNVVAIATSFSGQEVRDTSNNGYKIVPQFADPTILRLEHNFKDKVVIMGGFSPNDDKINDELSIFIPNGIYLEFLKIYNRWGTKIVAFDETHRRGNYILWDGKTSSNMNERVPEGTYYYSYKVKNDSRVYSNFITVKE